MSGTPKHPTGQASVLRKLKEKIKLQGKDGRQLIVSQAIPSFPMEQKSCKLTKLLYYPEEGIEVHMVEQNNK